MAEKAGGVEDSEMEKASLESRKAEAGQRWGWHRRAGNTEMM